MLKMKTKNFIQIYKMYNIIGLRFIILLFTFTCKQGFCQDEFFHELFFEKNIIENEKWEFNVEINSKYTYEEPKWRRWGVSFLSLRKLNKFRIFGGLNALYTFNDKIDNFYEIRPRIAIDYGIKLFNHTTFRPRIQTEWRFFFVEDNDTREDYNRTRFQLNFDVPLTKDSETLWMIRPRIEWFVVRNLASAERFSNERDIGITFIKHFKNEHRLLIGYHYEKFYNVDSEKSNGHIFSLGYIFM